MATPKLTLSASRDIPFDKLVLSQSNVRRTKAGVSIEELSEDIARRTLLQSLTVRAVCDADGVETGMFEIPAGGRRYRALERLVKQKRLAKSALIPCVIREGGIAEEDSLAENVQRAPLHPLDQFRAFLILREKGQSEEEIAATFFVSIGVVKQRLRLASVSPRLLDVYGDDGMTLDHLMAYTVNGDHARQEAVFDQLQHLSSKEPYAIRRMLTEGAVRASDKRAQFVGLDAYADAGGVILRDLFQGDGGGWLQDAGLLDRLVAERLIGASEEIALEGWKWTEAAPDLPYGHVYGLRQLRGESEPLTEAEAAARAALQSEYDELEAAFAADEELTQEADQRLAEIEAALAGFDERPVHFDAEDVARAGTFISLDADGALRIERGYVRPEDEPALDRAPEAEPEEAGEPAGDAGGVAAAAPETGSGEDPEEADGLTPISDRLRTELTTYRTLALRHVLGENPDIAFVAALHALCLKVFYTYGQDTCLELDLKTVAFSVQSPALVEGAAAKAIDERHQAWVAVLPKDSFALWPALLEFDADSRQSLFAHCVAQSVNAVYEPYHRRLRALAHAELLAQALDLNMAAAGWTPTVETYLGRVTKARILEAVRESKGQREADRIDHLKKDEMALAAEVLLEGSGWLPEALRTPGLEATSDSGLQDEPPTEDAVEPDSGGYEQAMVASANVDDDEAVTVDVPSIAAE